ncbi:hypothetical protein HMPREF1585_01222 [Gardnerella vaginalis JCP8481B]|nr:hypothetical protein HMPREF1585_01222 [Gardnerella vaginalis JCP8481B]
MAALISRHIASIIVQNKTLGKVWFARGEAQNLMFPTRWCVGGIGVHINTKNTQNHKNKYCAREQYEGAPCSGFSA